MLLNIQSSICAFMHVLSGSIAVFQEHRYLVHCRQVGDWKTFQCLNCNMQTHAVQSASKVLLNSALQSGQSVLHRLTRSSDFSSVFRIVLQNPATDLASSLPGQSVLTGCRVPQWRLIEGFIIIFFVMENI